MTIEELLAAGYHSEEARLEFFQRLPSESLFVLVNSQIPQGAQVFSIPGQPDFTWAVANVEGTPRVPAFTSIEKLEQFLNAVTGWEGRWVETSGKSLLKNLASSGSLYLEINPTSDHSLGLSPLKLKELVAGL